MKRLCIVALLVGCQRGEGSEKPPAPEGYGADIGKICDVAKLAGAPVGEGGRQVTIAMWLGANLATAEARQFLVRLNQVQGRAKADALTAEATKVGLDTCALADEWREPLP